jgi:hypothetical protein
MGCSLWRTCAARLRGSSLAPASFFGLVPRIRERLLRLRPRPRHDYEAFALHMLAYALELGLTAARRLAAGSMAGVVLELAARTEEGITSALESHPLRNLEHEPAQKGEPKQPEERCRDHGRALSCSKTVQPSGSTMRKPIAPAGHGASTAAQTAADASGAQRFVSFSAVGSLP